MTCNYFYSTLFIDPDGLRCFLRDLLDFVVEFLTIPFLGFYFKRPSPTVVLWFKTVLFTETAEASTSGKS